MKSPTASTSVSLDHVTIVTTRIDAVRDFLRDVAGLSDGPRPPFEIAGHWLYADGRAVVHIIDSTLPGGHGRPIDRIDHFALRVRNAAAWAHIDEQLLRHGASSVNTELPLTGERQLFVELLPGVVIEFVGALEATA